MPIDPPTCWLVLRVAEPTPASWGASPSVPVLNDGARLRPNPTPRTMVYGQHVAGVGGVEPDAMQPEQRHRRHEQTRRG